MSVLLVGCATASIPLAPPMASRESASTADLLTDIVGKVHQQYVDNVSVGRLTIQAIRGLETLAPGGVIQVVDVGSGVTITHGASGLPDSRVSVSWPASPTPADAGRALDEAGRFVARRLDANPPEVLDALVRGLISIDPAGAYLAPPALAELSGAAVAGSAGLAMTVRGGELMIVDPLPGGPGHRAGLRTGDRIRAVDGRSTEGMPLGDAVRLLRGPVGSRIVLTIRRADWDTPRDVAITREVVRVPSVEYHSLGGHVGYVRIRNLQTGTAGEVQNALGALRSLGADRFVLDLRGNPGGVLVASIEVAELFLPTGRMITYTEGRVRTQNMRFTAHAKSPVTNVPLVVLIDDGTASGAETIAAALQDWERALLVGTQSAGLATVQSAIPMPNGAQVRLTTARWFTPKGRSLAHRALTPDVEVTRGQDEEQWLRDPERDSQLRRAIQIVVTQPLR